MVCTTRLVSGAQVRYSRILDSFRHFHLGCTFYLRAELIVWPCVRSEGLKWWLFIVECCASMPKRRAARSILKVIDGNTRLHSHLHFERIARPLDVIEPAILLCKTNHFPSSISAKTLKATRGSAPWPPGVPTPGAPRAHKGRFAASEIVEMAVGEQIILIE